MNYRGNIALVIVIVLGALLAAAVLKTLSSPQLPENPEQYTQDLIAAQQTERRTQEMAEYNTGIIYSNCTWRNDLTITCGYWSTFCSIWKPKVIWIQST